MKPKQIDRRGVAWLELLFVIAVLVLLLQLFPSLCRRAAWAIDPRHWPRGAWLALNAGAILALLWFRIGPETKALRRSIRARRSLSASNRRIMVKNDADYEARSKRDAEWRERAKKRLPFV
jgi:hypothetical protein